MSSDSVLAERAGIDATIQGKTLCELVARNAQAYADQPALSWKQGGGWRALSWAEFRERVAEVAMGHGVFYQVGAREGLQQCVDDGVVEQLGV